ncbi:MAG: hypothetical protein JWR77_1143, partial [Rhizorhabdus sp.]|nr:hypothetical protein [Rhizorhabdus sp.]
IVDPGATATKMRMKAYPGEDQTTLKSPTVVAHAILSAITAGFETGHRLRVQG